MGFLMEIEALQAILLVLGIIFLIIEIFNPGFGVPGIIGFILVAAGIIITAKTVTEALIMLIIVIIILGIAVIFALRSASKGRLSKTMVLQDSLNKESGYSSTEDMTYFLNKTGKSLTPLRPSGTGEFEGVKLDIVSEGDFIEIDRDITVIKVEGRRIIVREIKG
jgi:membrane-bound ClpP family serine protease